ncbi:MFS transporter [Paenisporosarcina sp. OV554]|uniref:MDR family MFS transporter n=1 Tax=Paenisporosarcina sp. OV554 TaxID=2135694 RepID=UPI000D3DB6B6|nr:MFS transporter [Paenisporosarcina sp. OV554]PUB11013.1 putative MFS family arabinose efflux permease [Paenisporosarcina sp. OV554]
MRDKFSFHPVVWTLLIGTVFARGASFMAVPFLALYLSNTHGIHPILIGITIGLSPLTGTLGGFIGGYFSDRYGRKKVMLWTIFVWGLVYFGFSQASHIGTFMVLNALNGLCRSFFEPSSQALMADLTSVDKRKRVFSLRYTAINIGASLGPLLGVYVAQFSTSLPFLLTSMMYLLYGGTLFIMLNRYSIRNDLPIHQLPILDSLIVIWRDKTLLVFIIGGILVNIGYSQIDSNLPQYIQNSFSDGIALFAKLIALNAILVIVLQVPLSLVSEKWPVLRVMILGSILFAIGFASFGYVTTTIGLMMAMAIVTIGEIFIFPSTSVFIDQIAPDNRKGTYFGAGQFRSIGNFTGPVLGGWLLKDFGGTLLFSVIGIIILCSIIFYSLGYRNIQKKGLRR